MRFGLKLTAVTLLGLLPAVSYADSLIARYYVELGPQDFYNSSGTRLTTVGAIFQQDRANFHRFGIRHGGDSTDPVFSSREMRARIPTLLADSLKRGGWNFVPKMDPANAARPGYADYAVFVCGSNGGVTHMFINHADGDAYDDC